MKDRTARVARKTKETDILIELNLDNGKKGQPQSSNLVQPSSSEQEQPNSSNRGQPNSSKQGQPNSSKQGQPNSSSRGQIDTTIGFLDHMLDLFSAHSGIFLKIKAKGDTHIDDHHLVEDIGIALGNALQQALGDKKGIARYGQVLLPMDEALCYIALDLSGRFYLSYEAKILFQKTGLIMICLKIFFMPCLKTPR
jgi:imidazoleglycerol phosphate dehydratase HisB